MKMTSMKSAIKKLAFSLLVGGLLPSGNALANTDGDITSITSVRAGAIITAAGDLVEFRFSLDGYFVMTNVFGGTEALLPEIRMVVNGDVGHAMLASSALNQYTIAGGAVKRTDLVFKYRVKPGDLAQPLRVYGSDTIAYQIDYHGWQVVSFTNSAVTAVMKFNQALSFPSEGEKYDLDLAKANITLRALNFEDSDSETSIQAKQNGLDWRVTTVNPTESAVVDFYVWTPATNRLQIGNVENQTWVLLSMPTNTSYIEFPIKGLAVGTADVYLQRTKDYLNNTTAIGMTNYVKRSITMLPPPAPWVQLVMSATGTDNVTLNETNALNTGKFKVELSETFANDVYVQVNLAPTNHTYVSFNSTPMIVRVPAGQYFSSEQNFNVPDGNVTSMWGVTLSPVVTNAAAAAYYSDLKNGTVYVQNMKPAVTATASTPVFRGVPCTLSWNATDVAADMVAGMTVQWDFGDGTITNVVGTSGSLQHTFNTTKLYKVLVTATDKDGLSSDIYELTVNVENPIPRPSVRVVAEKTTYDETDTNNTGKLTIYLSESVDYDVYVQLAATMQGQSQSNLILCTTNAIRIASGSTNYTDFSFSVPDGTQDTERYGVDILPTVTNSPANAKFLDLRQGTVFVRNVSPVVKKPAARDVSLTPLPQYTNVPLGQPFTFDYRITDVPRDLDTMIVRWNFGDGTPDVVVTGAVGIVAHTFGTKGFKTVTVRATDKDGASSDEIEFPISVVSPPPPPTVKILPWLGAVTETTTRNTAYFTVQLSEPFTNKVTVTLSTTPINSPVSGTIVLATNLITFEVGETEKKVNFTAYDGTDESEYPGFTIIPKVIANEAATNYYTTILSDSVTLKNVAPTFTFPTASTTYTIAQGYPWPFSWAVSDVPLDSTTSPIASAMRVVWYFGDGTTQTVYGAAGEVYHTYNSIGDDITVRAVAIDKDGGQNEVVFKVKISPAKEVIVTPIGPNLESDYYGMPRQSVGTAAGTAGGLGDGIVLAPTARASINRNNVYFFTYEPGVASATLEAVPYKTSPPENYYFVTYYNTNGVPWVDTAHQITFDSFFFVWTGGTDQGLSEDKLNPAKTTSSISLSLPAASSSSEGVETREVQAIFSREWRTADNMGDINADGIPDKIANNILVSIGGDTANGSGDTPTWLLPLNTYNDDLDKVGGTAVGDFSPINPTGIGGVFDFRPVSASEEGASGIPVNAFTAIREVRGEHPGLNRPGISDVDGDADEPGTDPTLADTDGDGYTDGWEYWFWYNAAFHDLTGSAYNPADVGQGTFIASKVIKAAFQPTVAGTNGDTDNDGLRDIEEMTLGTNPIHWDTDNDGICDGWELMRTLSPQDPSDGARNPDGDYMAYASVERQYVTVVDSANRTNYYLAVGASVTTNTGSFTTCYRYGDSNAVWAVGRPVTLADDATVVSIQDVNALLLHFQVYNEFGFDPRTGWINIMNYRDSDYKRFPDWINTAPNTKAYTSRDEYLLMKFMAENRLNGNTDGLTAPSQSVWRNRSTNPRTPDTDADPETRQNDGMPDGWELYVAIDRGLNMNVAANRVMVISPWDPLDGANDHPVVREPPRDGLVNRREFGGTESSAAYTNAALYASTNAPAWVTITRPSADTTWINKFWPTNPWQPDTDGDGLNDLGERTFVYIPATAPIQDDLDTCTQGGGLNPNAKDTDFDAIPDHWESTFAGTMPENDGIYTGIVISNGMDGTVYDADADWDYDGLRNSQEYWVQAVRNYRYDMTDVGITNSFGVAGIPMDASYEPYMLFTPVTNNWDLSKYPWGDKMPMLWVLLPIGPSKGYGSTDPKNFDTDFDSMDDYYELFHGLNPILGDDIHTDRVLMIGADRIADAYRQNGAYTITYHGNDWGNSRTDMNFMLYPWLTGLPQADPDADGLLNLEEQLLANSSAPANYNTDPTPLWFTDASNPNSLTMRSFRTGAAAVMYFWPPLPVLPPPYMYSFEMNEGYDTDNDGISDKAELIDSRNAQASPQDHDDPVRRQAIWFSGTNAAASTVNMYANRDLRDTDSNGDMEFGFRSFTVELWIRPEVTNSHQVLLERAFYYGPSDASTPSLYVRRNFRVGIVADGRVYAGYDNAGADTHDPHTSTVMAFGHKVTPNEWVHIAARMSGADQTFTLFINGEVQSIVETALIPANGVLVIRDDPQTGSRQLSILAGSLVLGAANNAPVTLDTMYWSWTQSWADYDKFYQGYIDEVRIWDGARDNDSIRSDYKRRYTHRELWNNRATVASEMVRGYTRDTANSRLLSPLLLNHYTFDNLFGADRTNSVVNSPRGYTNSAVAVNHPVYPGAEVSWWSTAEIRSTVYNDYSYLPWIENGYDHMPLFGGATTNLLLMTNTVRDSVYWTHTAAGPTNQINVFPNRCTPYGAYFTYNGGGGRDLLTFSRDLLPLGGAYAKQVEDMWDDRGPAESWLETGADSDADGLADWWELSRYGNLSNGWNDLYTLDSMEMTNGQRYQRDIAGGATESNPTGGGKYTQTADTDGDGLPDWWEKMFNLNNDSSVGRDGAAGDPDRDGLSNLAEYWISEVYRFHYLSPLAPTTLPDQKETDYFEKKRGTVMTFGAMFADHDFMEDAWEDNYSPYYINRFVYDAHLDNDGDGWSNWSESRGYSDPSRNMHIAPDGMSEADFPVPKMAIAMSYSGIRPESPLVISAYSDPAMDGIADAVFNVPAPSLTGATEPYSKNLSFWSARKITGYLPPGAIKPGSVKINFTDVSKNPAQTVEAAYDVYTDISGLKGTILGQDGSGWSEAIGTINYVTGEYTIDLTWYQGLIIVQAVSPTVVYRVNPASSYMTMVYEASQVAGWPKTIYLSDADQGYLLEGTNYFFAFMDVNSSGTWDAGEPCGVPTPFATDVNWDVNKISIQLTDYTPSYLRMTLQPAVRSEDIYFGATGGEDAGGGDTGTELSALATRVRVRRSLVDNTAGYQKIVLDKTFDLRTYIHEGDFLSQGGLGLDWGLEEVNTSMSRVLVAYEVYVGDTVVLTNSTKVLSFTNYFDSVQAKSTAVSPINGAYVYSARPTFRWSMPENYTAFALEIRKGTSTGQVIYQSGEVQAPLRDVVTGQCIWEAPIHARSKLPNGQIFAENTVYAWRVIALNSKFTLALSSAAAWSDWKTFRLDVNAPMQSSGYGEIKTVVKYLGPVTDLSGGRVKVQVYNTRGFTGVPAAQYSLTDAEVGYLTTSGTTNVNAQMRGLAQSSTVGDYYICAFIDQNMNNHRDEWESWGYANYYGLTDKAYDVYPFTVAFSTKNETAHIYIEDADTDQDWFPDAWEYQLNPGNSNFLGLTGPSSDWDGAGDTEINTNLVTSGAWVSSSIFSTYAAGSTDQDKDGLNDMAELLLGTKANSMSTAGDGYSDMDKVSLGLSPSDVLSLGVTGFGANPSVANIQWQMNVRKDTTVDRTYLQAITGIVSDGTVRYNVEFKVALDDPAWTVIETGTVTLDGVQGVFNQIDKQAIENSDKGFFRVRLSPVTE